MTPVPLAGLSTRARLWLGAALCILALGLAWSRIPGGLASGLYQGCNYVPGLGGDQSVLAYGLPTGILSCEVIVTSILETPGHVVSGSQTPARVFLVFAVLVLAYAATHRRTTFTKRLVRAATGAMAVATALAVAERAILPSVCLLGALALVAPPAWQFWPRLAVFGPSTNGPA